MKIRNRSLHYNVLPRVAPFLCSKCGYATVALRKIEEHVCMKKNSSVIDLERGLFKLYKNVNVALRV